MTIIIMMNNSSETRDYDTVGVILCGSDAMVASSTIIIIWTNIKINSIITIISIIQ